MSDQWQALYGTADGATWYVVRGVLGRIPPSEIAGVPLLGETSEVIRKVLMFRMECVRRATGNTPDHDRVRRDFACELGSTEEQCETYANDLAMPDLGSEGWASLARSYYFIRSEALMA